MYNKSLIEAQILEALNAEKKVSVKWNCGGDEALIALFLDDKEVPYDDELAQETQMYLVNYLDLPDAGEFYMDGDGNIIEENGKLYIEYESIWRGDNEKEPMYSGKQRLF